MCVQVNNRLWERLVVVVITFDGKYRFTPIGFGRFKNDLIGHVTTRQQYIGSTRAVPPMEIVNVRYDQNSHLQDSY
jgi:hypothetical protein